MLKSLDKICKLLKQRCIKFWSVIFLEEQLVYCENPWRNRKVKDKRKTQKFLPNSRPWKQLQRSLLSGFPEISGGQKHFFFFFYIYILQKIWFYSYINYFVLLKYNILFLIYLKYKLDHMCFPLIFLIKLKIENHN